MNEVSILEHKVNPNCNCSKYFVKSIMDETGGSYQKVINTLMELQDRGMLEIRGYDSEGFPTEIILTISKKKAKELIG